MPISERTDEQNTRLDSALATLRALPPDLILQDTWLRYVDLGDAVEDTEDSFYVEMGDIGVSVEQILDPRCIGCTAGTMVRCGLQAMKTPPTEIVLLDFLKDYYGLSQNEIDIITYWNDTPDRAKAHGKPAKTAKTGGIRAVENIIAGRDVVLEQDGKV